MPGHAVGLAVMGNFLYVADRDSGLQVVDVSTPSSPVIVGHVSTPGYAAGVAVTGDHAYVADGPTGPDELSRLVVADITTPESPLIVGSVDLRGYARRVFLAGDFTDWKPLRMRKRAGAFSITLSLPPGRHQYKFIVDDTWILDPDNSDWAVSPMRTRNSVVRVW